MSPSWDLNFSQYLGTHGPKIGYFPKSFSIKDLYFFSLTHLMMSITIRLLSPCVWLKAHEQ
jgi:hypothetical protein